MRSFKRVGISLVIFLIIVAVFFWQLQNITDWYKLRGYSAPSEISNIASQDTMTGYATKLFYINHPEILDRSTFGQKCPNNGGETSTILGCYLSIQRGIYIFQVSDPTLNGVEQVTAAHEMLHGAWDRLSESKKAEIGAQLLDYYNNHLDNQTIKDQISIYKKTEPNALVNEMHSVFGTEIGKLPSSLETYYSQYFTDRQKIVGLSDSYQQVFINYKDQITTQDNQLKSLKSQIDYNLADIKTQQATIAEQRSSLNNLMNSNQVSQYNSMVPRFNAQVDQYNSLVSSTQDMISQYNSLIKVRNDVATGFDNLSNELNSNLTTLKTQ